MDSLAVAFVGGLVGGTVAAIIGGIVTLTVQTRQHSHERTVALEGRLQQRREATYERMLEYAVRIRLQIDRTSPVISFGADPEPPPPLPEEDWIHLGAVTGLHATAAVQARVRDVTGAAGDFNSALIKIKVTEGSPTPTFKFDETWGAMEEARKRIRAGVDALAAQANHELASADL